MIAAMRIAVLFLLLANLLLFAWARAYLGAPASADARRVDEQLLPEQVKVVSRDRPSRANGKKEELEKMVDRVDNKVDKVADKGASEICQLWTELASADADQLERLLADQFAAFRATRGTTGETSGYWVYIPPLASREEASRKTAELQELGIKEFFVVPNGGTYPLAISLGVYRNEEAAKARLESLRAKGVRSAKVAERKGKTALSTLEIRGPEAQTEALGKAIVALLPKASPATCKTRTETAP
ncbi:MAG TPA: hypothetical protein DHV85_05890 [Candidatus Accumulibacter sp.]|nr:hypothetical protein [Accumulibacter sp.]